MHGWTGKILSINLTDKKHAAIGLDEDIYRRFIGGRGLTGYFLRNFAGLEWDSPEMPLVFMTGPLVGTPSPTSGRMTIASKSPLTGTMADTSVGGKLGTMIKRAGLDGFIITGKSALAGLAGITITASGVEFHDAGGARGLGIEETAKKYGGRGSTAAIGPAAENGVRFANISVDGHFFSGRNGLGLVMAAKNLKFINVDGNLKTDIFDREELDKAREEIFRLVSASPILETHRRIWHFRIRHRRAV